jgi:predicted oxidoreductase
MADQPTTFDVIVIGGGAAGTCAAIEAGRAGARTLVLEAGDEPGGAAALSSGGICVVDTPLQRAQGIVDSVELALGDWLAWGGADAVDEPWARTYLERARVDLYDWVTTLGVLWDAVFDEEGNSVDRWHRVAGGGPELMARLRAATAPLPVTWRCGARAEHLLIEDGRVVGVRVAGEAGDGRAGGRDAGAVDVRAGAVVVATGGFAGDPSALARWAPQTAAHPSLLCGGGPGADGSGHALLATAGAAFVGLDRLWIYPFGIVDDRDGSGRRGIAVRGIPDEVWVNADGRRFHDESHRGAASGAPALLAQPGGTCWAILDARGARDLSLTDPFFGGDEAPRRDRLDAFLERSDAVVTAPTVEELARAAGLPQAATVATIEAVNAWLADGRETDPEFGRDLRAMTPITQPPFTAVQLRPLARKCLGGARTDPRCAVLDRHDQVIPGLFAAGEVAGMAGGHINGRAALEGTMLGPSLLSGRIAGEAAAAGAAGRAGAASGPTGAPPPTIAP